MIPYVWFLLDYTYRFRDWQDDFINLQFAFRGEIDCPMADSGSSSERGKTEHLKLVYVNIDEKAIKFMGSDPIPISFYATAAEAIFKEGKAKTVGIEVIFKEEKPSSLIDQAKLRVDEATFKKIVTQFPNLVLAAAYSDNDGSKTGNAFNEIVPFPYLYRGSTDPSKNSVPLQPSEKLIGKDMVGLGLLNADAFFNHPIYPRYAPVFARAQGNTFYTMALQLYRNYCGFPEEAIQIDDTRNQQENHLVMIGINGKIILNVPLAKGQLVEVNWFARWKSPKDTLCSLADVLEMKKNLETGSAEAKARAKAFFKQFENAVILIGQTDPSFLSLIYSTIDEEQIPSIAMHGNLLKTLFSGRFITRLPPFGLFLIIFALNAITATAIFYGDKIRGIGKFAIVLFIAYWIAGFLMFGVINPNIHLILPLFTPTGSVLTIVLLGITNQWFAERRQKRRIKRIFGNYLAPELVRDIVGSAEQPHLGGLEKEVTAFFSDVQSFSSFAEMLTPTQVVELMNEYFTVMTDVIKAEGGTLDKFIGDAIVAMFGAPMPTKDHALKACIAACKMQEKHLFLREKWRKEHLQWPKEVFNLRTRIGINTGLVTIGNMGSSSRFNYTMMGDNVNLAARCESGAKIYGVYALVTEDTYNASRKDGREVVFRFLDKMIAKGRQHPVGVYEIVGLCKSLPDSAFECLDLFEKGLQHYNKKEWATAKTFFERSSILEPLQPGRDVGVLQNPSLVYVEKCSRENHFLQK